MKPFDIRVFMASVRREAGEEEHGNFTLKDARSLLKRNNEDFVREAYWRILGRDVDPGGLAGYTPRAGSLPGKAIILVALMLSPERLLLPDYIRSFLKIAATPLKGISRKS